MKFTYFRQRSSDISHTHPQSELQDAGLKYLRERVIRNIYYVISILGGLAYIANLPTILQNQRWVTLAIYTVIILGVFIFAFIQKIPYLIKAIFFLSIVYLVGLSDLLSDGLYGSGRIFFLILPIMTGLLIGLRGRIAGISVSVATLASVGALMMMGYLPAPEPNASTSNDSLAAWLIAIASFTLIVAVTSVVMGIMIQGLDNSLRNQSRLTSELEIERTQLEQRVMRRTEEIERRLVQLRTAAEISRTISTILDIQQLFPRVCQLVQQRFNLYYAGIFLIEESLPAKDRLWEREVTPTKYAVLVAGSGEEGRKMLSEGHRLEVGGESMIGWCTANKQAKIALDVGKEAVRFNNPFLPETRSELALPIQAQNIVLGALTIQSTRSSAFDQDDITILQGVADSLAGAIENAHLFSEVQSNLQEIQSLHHQYLERSWNMMLSKKSNLEYSFQDKTQHEAKPQRKIQMPILLRDQSIGHIVIEADELEEDNPNEWKPEELALIETITAQAALALENARLLDETQKRVLQEEQLNQIMEKSQKSLMLDTVMKTFVQEVGKSVKSAKVAIRLDNQVNQEIQSSNGNGNHPKSSNHRTATRSNGSSKPDTE